MCQTLLQQLPQVMSHKLIAPLRQVKPITQVDRVVLPSKRQRLVAEKMLSYSMAVKLTGRCNFIDKSRNIHSMISRINLCSPTCPSFCMSVHRSRTSEPQLSAACTHARAYCPATELRRLIGLPGKEDYIETCSWAHIVITVNTTAWRGK